MMCAFSAKNLTFYLNSLLANPNKRFEIILEIKKINSDETFISFGRIVCGVRV